MKLIPKWLHGLVGGRSTGQPEKPQLTLGFIPLTDCAPLVVAQERGYFEAQGLEVTLAKETSWANIRDKLAIGLHDGAQMLASMPLAMELGLGPVQKPVITALTLDLNGNAITLSEPLYQRLLEHDPEAMAERPCSARALRKVIDADRAAGRLALTLATVFPISTHTYELRYWLAAAGIDPDRDLRLRVVPPPQMVNQLRAGNIDGYCVGEPWNRVAVEAGLGRVVITSHEIWANRAEKVFGVTAEWAERHPHTHQALLRALLQACRWLDAPEHRSEAAALLAQPGYVNAPLDTIGGSLTGLFRYARGAEPALLPDFNVFHRYAANFPWRSHAVWFLTQMVRWGQLDPATDLRAVAEAVYRPDLYREAAGALAIAAPIVDDKVEGTHAAAWSLEAATAPLTLGPDRFFDGGRFDPADWRGYLDQFPVRYRAETMQQASVQ